MMSVQSIPGISLYPPKGAMASEPVVMDDRIPMAGWTRGLKKSAIAEMLQVMTRPGLISFALGLPAPELFPVDEYLAAMARALGDRTSLQYRPPYASLKRHVVRIMARRGVRCTEDQVFLTTAAQQGLSLLASTLLEPGSQVIAEPLVYSGFVQALAPHAPRILKVGTDPETGIDVDAVEAHLASGARPAFIYVITDGHNPVGVSVSREKRVRLVELARRYRVPIVEDDAYGLLSYEDAIPPMRSMEDRWVLYVGSLSKVMAPGFRVGWLVVPEEMTTALAAAKEGSDIDTATFTQRLVAEYLDAGGFDAHLDRIRDAYRLRRDTMLAALERHFPTGARWTRPRNGALIWLELEPHVDTGKLLRVAVETEGVAFVPGPAFSIDGSRTGASSLRLNFSHPSPAEIDDGIGRLAHAARNTFS